MLTGENQRREVLEVPIRSFPGDSGSPIIDVKIGEVVGLVDKADTIATPAHLLKRDQDEMHRQHHERVQKPSLVEELVRQVQL
jgi:hypothetical protein